MNLLGRALAKLNLITVDSSGAIRGNNPFKRPRYFRNYQGAIHSRLTNDWLTTSQSADEILKWQLAKLRQRSRDLWMNNDYAKAFGRKLIVNVVGPAGIRLQNKARSNSGKLDKAANKVIEQAFRTFCKPVNLTVTGQISRRELDGLTVQSVARDGEVFFNKIRGHNNEFRYALQMIEPDLVDINLNKKLANGNEIVMGIEFNPYKKPVAYYIKKTNSEFVNRHTRMPADRIIHVYVRERADQSRGVPWIHTAILRLRSLGAYEEAAIIASRVGASGMGMILKPNNPDAKWQGDTEDDPDENEEDSGSFLDDVAPGAMVELPVGADFKTYDPPYPNQAHEKFMKAVLRGASAGMGISYNSLSSDLEGVNFSSIRQGVLEDRDWYKIITTWLTEHFHDNYFPEWLENAIVTGHVNLPILRFNKFNAPHWRGRGFQWIDPLKDTKANVEASNNYHTSPQKICEEKGYELEEIIEDHVAFHEMLKANNLPVPGQVATKPLTDEEEEENEDQEDETDPSEND